MLLILPYLPDLNNIFHLPPLFKKALVPADKVESYFLSKDIPISNAESVNEEFFDSNSGVNACVFRGMYHGGFTEQPDLIPPIVTACRSLCRKVERPEGS